MIMINENGKRTILFSVIFSLLSNCFITFYYIRNGRSLLAFRHGRSPYRGHLVLAQRIGAMAPIRHFRKRRAACGFGRQQAIREGVMTTIAPVICRRVSKSLDDVPQDAACLVAMSHPVFHSACRTGSVTRIDERPSTRGKMATDPPWASAIWRTSGRPRP